PFRSQLRPERQRVWPSVLAPAPSSRVRWARSSAASSATRSVGRTSSPSPIAGVGATIGATAIARGADAQPHLRARAPLSSASEMPPSQGADGAHDFLQRHRRALVLDVGDGAAPILDAHHKAEAIAVALAQGGLDHEFGAYFARP